MTTLPVDYRSRPWKDKYLFFETPVLNGWFIFGEYPDGTVGISDGDTDVMEYVPLDVAEKIVAAREAFVFVIQTHLCG